MIARNVKQLNVLLIVTLHDPHSVQASEFEREMMKQQWMQLANLPGTFCKQFDDPEDDAEVLDIAQQDVAQSVEAAGIDGWDGVCILSPNPPVPL